MSARSARQERIKAVLIDVGGVLLLPDPSIVLAALRQFDVDCPPDRIDRAAYSGGQTDLGLAADDASDVVDRVVTHYAQSAGMPAGRIEEALPVLRQAIFDHDWVLRDPHATLAALRRLDEAELRIAFVSNAEGETRDVLALRRIYGSEGAAVRRAEIVDSGEVGVAKPNPAIFEIALEMVGVPASAAVHIGDSIRNDIAPAQSLGIHALHFNPYELCERRDHGHTASLGAAIACVLADVSG